MPATWQCWDPSSCHPVILSLPVLERRAAGLLRDMRCAAPAAVMGWPPGKEPPPGAPGNRPPSMGWPPASLLIRVRCCEDHGGQTHLEKLSGVTRGDLLSWSMASWGEGAGKGRTRLGGLPGLIWEAYHGLSGTDTRTKLHSSDQVNTWLRSAKNVCCLFFYWWALLNNSKSCLSLNRTAVFLWFTKFLW